MTTDNSIEARLQRFEDSEAIRRLRLQFHRYVNDRVIGKAVDLCTEDALVDFGPTLQARGHAEIAALFEKLAGNTDMIKQFSANHIVDLDGDVATGNAYVDARYAAGGQSIIACASYDDTYRRTPEGWKFSEMIVHIHFTVPVQEGWGNIVERKSA